MTLAAAISPLVGPIPTQIAPTSRTCKAVAQAKRAEAWATGLKYDANNIYLATFYSETRKMTPITGGFANKTQNFEAVAQYQFDFGLRPSLGYVLSKGKDY
ncbi:outer membrane phosphoporin protein E [Escherichia coli]|uniref:Outer membrane porin PhoE n=1 Tax=Escherichia coli TaxID=562 RepID=A0A376RNU1_ECOLX|nr:outer membrane phosphoporin protein E [Escherichia coli]